MNLGLEANKWDTFSGRLRVAGLMSTDEIVYMGEYCLLFLPLVLSFPVRVSSFTVEMGDRN